MYTNNRDAYRQAFYIAWQKYQKQLALESVEKQLVQAIVLHPEYHSLLEDIGSTQNQEYALEENPFFHMSLHVAIQEQIDMNRPFGITAIHQALMEKHSDKHEVLHLMMQCLAKIMWQAQQTGAMPSEEVYLQELRGL